MIGTRPKFMDSPFFVDDPGNWHLRPGAPPEVVAEFDEFMAQDEDPPTASVDEILAGMKKQ